ncbi:probable nucleoredoxin 2 isoform X2 [Amborella trichopoda]|uniref:probable nucleoredoxin 2 isoform X2 n=1 Tax=Amborella trichopoda TaxID=13333 RepID=UPI0005D31E78|nr:probable nucleoredoxin 2 isoform X2 [Amborella trichopoda]|eukprot:XP_011627599.1 probable nucleoredoxin 2 isoform X2 [Amborella trichopoda]
MEGSISSSSTVAVASPSALDRNLKSLLSSDERDFLITPTGTQVKVEELHGMTVGLYFAANWYFQCQNFTPVLASVYEQLKQRDANFEIVFISCDEDQSSFDKYHATMPWLAIPFSDLKTKKSLNDMFQVEGIPCLIILDQHAHTVQTEAVELIYRYGVWAFPFTKERVVELESEEKAKHESQTLENLISIDGRDFVIGHDNEQVPISSLVGKTVGLYFSAQWCPPCVKFTPRDEAGFLECFKPMPWLALPFGDERIKGLSRYFNIQGIPALVIIGPNGKTVTREGRNLINLHMEKAYPFTQDHILFLQKEMDEEAKSFPRSSHHSGHHHMLNLVSAASGGGPFICCECDEQGSGWAYQCIDCGYEVHPKCIREAGKESSSPKNKDRVRDDPFCTCSSGGA